MQAFDHVARVVDDVALPPGARNRQQMVVEDEDTELGRLGELLLDPPVAAATDLAVVEVRLGRVDGDDRDPVLAQDGVAAPEQLLEVRVADVSRVVIAGDDDERLAVDPIEVPLRLGVLLLESVRGQVAGADDDLGLQLVDLRDRALHQVGHEVPVAAVDVGEVGDRLRGAHGRSVGVAPSPRPSRQARPVGAADGRAGEARTSRSRRRRAALSGHPTPLLP